MASARCCLCIQNLILTLIGSDSIDAIFLGMAGVQRIASILGMSLLINSDPEGNTYAGRSHIQYLDFYASGEAEYHLLYTKFRVTSACCAHSRPSTRKQHL